MPGLQEGHQRRALHRLGTAGQRRHHVHTRKRRTTRRSRCTAWPTPSIATSHSPILNAGVIFANADQTDSAIVYFQKASEIAEQTNAVEDRNLATRNWGALLQRTGRHKEAVPVLEKYVGWVPKDVDVKRALASSYRATGQNDKAKVIENEVGAALPRGRGQAAGCAAGRKMSAAIALYNEKKYAEAANGLREGAGHRAVQS